MPPMSVSAPDRRGRQPRPTARPTLWWDVAAGWMHVTLLRLALKLLKEPGIDARAAWNRHGGITLTLHRQCVVTI